MRTDDGAAPIGAGDVTTGSRPAAAAGPSRDELDRSALPDEAHAVALAGLDDMGPRRLRALLDGRSAAEAWDLVAGPSLLRGASDALRRAVGPHPDDLLARWRASAARVDPHEVWASHVHAGVGVAVRGSAAYPSSFADDPDPPAMVFTRGDPDALVGPRVAIVGTRNATRYGLDVARRLARELSEAGVSVVSGLALGVDGAAHHGALDADGAPPIAVVGSGLDRPYPWRNAELWRRVAEAGVVVGEYPLGVPPLAWHFPARNRLIAALADVVVVVESREAGGSMITVDEAIVRGREVMAVPGPVGSVSSAGTNHLLADGRAVVRDAVDVLVQLGMSDGARRSASERRPPPEGHAAAVLAELGWQPATIDQLVLRCGLGLGVVAGALDELVDHGWVQGTGGWFERVAKGAR